MHQTALTRIVAMSKSQPGQGIECPPVADVSHNNAVSQELGEAKEHVEVGVAEPQAEEVENRCRVCREDAPPEELIMPCDCRGSMAKVDHCNNCP